MRALENLRAIADTVTTLGDRLTERLAAVERELSGRQFRATCDSGAVTATVDWRADVTAIDIGVVMTRTRGPELAAQVTQAVNRARAEAGRAVAETMRAIA
jgi:hypothetical protein